MPGSPKIQKLISAAWQSLSQCDGRPIGFASPVFTGFALIELLADYSDVSSVFAFHFGHVRLQRCKPVFRLFFRLEAKDFQMLMFGEGE